MQNQLTTLSDEALDQVSGGATVDISFTFPTPRELIKANVSAIAGVIGAVHSGIASLFGLFGFGVSVSSGPQ